MLVAIALTTLLSAAPPPSPAAVPVTEAPAAWAPAVAKAQESGRSFQKALQARLGAALAQGGPPAAIEVCATEAPRIAAEAGKAAGVKLGRTSDRLRSSANAPPEWTRASLQAAAGKKGADVQPLVVDLGSNLGVLLPITVGVRLPGLPRTGGLPSTQGEGGAGCPLPGRSGGGVRRGRLPRLPLGRGGEVAPPDRAASRLRSLPWDALEGVASALEAPLGEVLAGTAAERVLDRFLRSRRDLAAAGRRAAAEAIFGVGLWRRRLRFHVGEDAPPLLLLASLLRDLAGRGDAARLCGLPAAALPPVVDPPGDLATRYSLPDWLAAILVREAGDEAPLLADALSLPGPVFLRVNRAPHPPRRADHPTPRRGARDAPHPSRPGRPGGALPPAQPPRPPRVPGRAPRGPGRGEPAARRGPGGAPRRDRPRPLRRRRGKDPPARRRGGPRRNGPRLRPGRGAARQAADPRGPRRGGGDDPRPGAAAGPPRRPGPRRRALLRAGRPPPRTRPALPHRPGRRSRPCRRSSSGSWRAPPPTSAPAGGSSTPPARCGARRTRRWPWPSRGAGPTSPEVSRSSGSGPTGTAPTASSRRPGPGPASRPPPDRRPSPRPRPGRARRSARPPRWCPRST